eukprot:m.167932 g.167932  ORF g.167932 m.167932 type:complete len:683 (-) comp12897_c0_seq1:200-2248(-)
MRAGDTDALSVGAQGKSDCARLSLGDEDAEYNERATRMFSEVEAKDRTYHFRKYRNVFLGSEAVQWLLREDDVGTIDEALAVGNELLSRGYFRHTCNDHMLKNEKLFYVWTFDPSSGIRPVAQHDDTATKISPGNGRKKSSRQVSLGSPGKEPGVQPVSASSANRDVKLDKDQLTRIKDEMRENLVVRDRVYHFQKYKRCFVARDAVDWLVAEGYAPDRTAGVRIGLQLMRAQAFRHVVNPDQPFADAYLFFRWVEDDEAAFMRDIQAWCLEDIESITDDEEDRPCAPDVRAAALKLIRVAQVLHTAHDTLAHRVADDAARVVRCERQRTAAWMLAAAAVTLAIIGWGAVGVILGGALTALAAYTHIDAEAQATDARRATTADMAEMQMERKLELDEAVAQAEAAVPSMHEDSVEDTDCVEQGRQGGDCVDPRAERLRLALCTEFPESGCPYSNVYLASVLCKSSRKDPKRPRSFTYALEKLIKAQRWRQTLDIQSLSSRTRGTSCGSLYWCGFDAEKRPILWVHPTRKDWKNLDLDDEVELHVAMIEYGISIMPPGVTTFVVIANAKGLGFAHINASFAKLMLKIITTGYPDRLEAMYAGPVNMALRSIFSLLAPLMPQSLSSKINLMGTPKLTLEEALGSESVPDFFEGPCSHDALLGSSDHGAFSVDKMVTTMQHMKPV